MTEPGSRSPKKMAGTETSFCLKCVKDTSELVDRTLERSALSPREEEAGELDSAL
jgi:hypothetical protein